MAELLFIATTIFVAYVIFVVIGDKKNDAVPNKESAKAKPVPQPEIETESPSSPPAAETPSKPASKPASPKPTPAEPIAEKPASAASDSLTNPKTGEVAKIPANYSFAKRWIKDALVEEGLLDKVYKNNELNETTQTKIQEALEKLKAMEKYR